MSYSCQDLLTFWHRYYLASAVCLHMPYGTKSPWICAKRLMFPCKALLGSFSCKISHSPWVHSYAKHPGLIPMKHDLSLTTGLIFLKVNLSYIMATEGILCKNFVTHSRSHSYTPFGNIIVRWQLRPGDLHNLEI